jgi:hypothetical protein
MSTTDHGGANVAPDEHATDDHAPDDHGHGHGADALGPIDVAAWGAGALGVALGLAVAFCFVVATSLMSSAPG